MYRKNNWIYIGRIRFRFERNWRNRPYPWWFNTSYSDGSQLKRRLGIPFFTIDVLRKK